MILNCEKATLLIEMRDEEKLSLWQNMQLSLHLAMCKHCKAFENQFKIIKKVCDNGHSNIDDSLSFEEKSKMELAQKK